MYKGVQSTYNQAQEYHFALAELGVVTGIQHSAVYAHGILLGSKKESVT